MTCRASFRGYRVRWLGGPRAGPRSSLGDAPFPTERDEPYFGGGLAFPKGTRGGSGRRPRARAPLSPLPGVPSAPAWRDLEEACLLQGGLVSADFCQNHPTLRGVPAEVRITLSPGMGPRHSGIGTLDGLRPAKLGPASSNATGLGTSAVLERSELRQARSFSRPCARGVPRVRGRLLARTSGGASGRAKRGAP